jgi:ATP-dependent Clp protease ATP-binding subunit ClpC
MTELFSQRMLDVIRLAREEAIRLGHKHIGTEDLLLGIIREGHGIAVKVLRERGADLLKIKLAIESIMPVSGPVLTIHNLPLTKQSEKILKIAKLEALLYRTQIIGTEHLLLAILREEDNAAAQVLGMFNIDYDGARSELDKLVTKPPMKEKAKKIAKQVFGSKEPEALPTPEPPAPSVFLAYDSKLIQAAVNILEILPYNQVANVLDGLLRGGSVVNIHPQGIATPVEAPSA